MDIYQAIKQAEKLTVTTRTKAEHKHNSHIFMELTKQLEDAFPKSSMFLAIPYIEDYITAANRDYSIYTAKQLAVKAHYAKNQILEELNYIIKNKYEEVQP